MAEVKKMAHSSAATPEQAGLENPDLPRIYELMEKLHKLLVFLTLVVTLLLDVMVMSLVQGNG